jgi:hypothetical protein
MPDPAPSQPVEGTVAPDAILAAWEPEKTYDIPKSTIPKTTVTSSTVTSSTVTSSTVTSSTVTSSTVTSSTVTSSAVTSQPAASSKPTESKPMLDSDDDEEDEYDDLPAFDMSHDVKVVRGKDAPTFRYLRDVLDHLGEVGVVEYLAEFMDPVRKVKPALKWG